MRNEPTIRILWFVMYFLAIDICAGLEGEMLIPFVAELTRYHADGVVW